jgi:hypothetical protein
MKYSLRILVALSYLVCVTAQAQSQNVFGNAPIKPTYDDCPMITERYGNANELTRQKPDDGCVKSKNDEYNKQVYNYSKQLISSDDLISAKPVEPKYQDCDPDNNICNAKNQGLQSEYNNKMEGWIKLQNEHNVTNDPKASVENKEILEVKQQKSTSEILAEAQAKAKKAQDTSNKAANIAAAASAASAAYFAFTCAGGGTCNWAALAASIAFDLMSAQNSKQADYNREQALSICKTQIQISSASPNCEATVPAASDPTQDNSTNAINKNFDSNGNCISSDKAKCAAITSALPVGTNIKDLVKGASAFASAPQFKINSDGSVTLKNGKTLTPADFKKADALKAAGFTDEQAQAMMGSFAKAASSSGLESALKKDLKNAGYDKGSDFGGFSISGMGGSGGSDFDRKNGGSGKGVNGNLSGKGMGGGRNPAGEGLTRDFNGEAIGAAGDDIFSMMNRRYKMKTAQDSFISN